MELRAEQLKQSHFEAVCDSVFTVSLLDQPAHHWPLKLTALRARPAPKGFEQYSLQLLGPVEPILPQGTYCFSHEKLEDMPLFMTPLGQYEDGVEYEVCVTRSTKDD